MAVLNISETAELQDAQTVMHNASLMLDKLIKHMREDEPLDFTYRDVMLMRVRLKNAERRRQDRQDYEGALSAMKDITVPSSVDGVDLLRLTENRRLTYPKNAQLAMTTVEVEVNLGFKERMREATLFERNTAELKGREKCERAWREAFGLIPWDRARWNVVHTTLRCTVELVVDPE